MPGYADYLAPFTESPEERRARLLQSLAAAGAAMLGTPRGQEWQGLGRAGLAGIGIDLIRRRCDRLQHFTFITYGMSGSSGLLAIDVERDLLVMRIAFYVDRCICIVYKLKIFAGALRDRRICGRIHIAYDHGMIITFRYFQLRK